MSVFFRTIVFHEVFYAIVGGLFVLLGQVFGKMFLDYYKRPELDIFLKTNGNNNRTLYICNAGKTAFFDPIVQIRFSENTNNMSCVVSAGGKPLGHNAFSIDKPILPNAEQLHLVIQTVNGDLKFPKHCIIEIYSSNRKVIKKTVILDKEVIRMRILKTRSFLWWEMGLVKLCLLSLGVLLGLYFSSSLFSFVPVLWVIFFVTAVYFFVKFFREKE